MIFVLKSIYAKRLIEQRKCSGFITPDNADERSTASNNANSQPQRAVTSGACDIHLKISLACSVLALWLFVIFCVHSLKLIRFVCESNFPHFKFTNHFDSNLGAALGRVNTPKAAPKFSVAGFICRLVTVGSSDLRVKLEDQLPPQKIVIMIKKRITAKVLHGCLAGRYDVRGFPNTRVLVRRACPPGGCINIRTNTLPSLSLPLLSRGLHPSLIIPSLLLSPPIPPLYLPSPTRVPSLSSVFF